MAPVVNPNLGLYFDRPRIALGSRMLQNGLNFRVKNGKLSNLSLGWSRFGTFTLNGPVVRIDNFFLRDGTEHLIFITPTDIYKYNSGPGTVSYITPRYETGTASVSGTAVTGTGTDWDPNVKAGDEIHFGASGFVDPTGTWFTIQSRTNDTALVLTASAGVVGNGAYTIRKKFTGDTLDLWITTVFVNASPSNSDEWWATNGVDVPVRWNGTDTQVEMMTSLGFTCKALANYHDMMIFLNLNQGGTHKPTDIINSNPGEPQNVTTGLSEQFKVHGGSDGILSALPIGDTLAIYSGNTVTVTQFVGSDLLFVFRNAITGIGPLGARAITDFGDFHEFVGHDAQYTFDGVTVKKVNNHVWREIIRQQDPVRVATTYSHFDEENGDIIWVMPLTSDTGSGTESSPPAKAFVKHYLEEVGDKAPFPHSARSFPFTATGYFSRQSGLTWNQLTQTWAELNFRWNDQFFSAAFPLNLAGDNNGKIYTINTAQNADSVALSSYVLFGRRAVIDGRNRGLVKRIYPFVSTFSNPLSVTLHLIDHADGTATINNTSSFDQTLPQGGHFVSPFRVGRFMEVEFGSAGPSQPWEIAGYDLDVKKGGLR